MTAYAYTRGHKIEWDEAAQIWRYADTGEAAFDGAGEFGGERPCRFCHLMPTPEGHDACLGELPDVRYACCGHGIEGEGYILYEKRPYWMTNKNRWPAVFMVAGWLPFLSLAIWVIYNLFTTPGYGLADYFVWWLLCLVAMVAIWRFAHWLNHKQVETANLLRRARHQAYAASTVRDAMN